MIIYKLIVDINDEWLHEGPTVREIYAKAINKTIKELFDEILAKKDKPYDT